MAPPGSRLLLKFSTGHPVRRFENRLSEFHRAHGLTRSTFRAACIMNEQQQGREPYGRRGTWRATHRVPGREQERDGDGKRARRLHRGVERRKAESGTPTC